MPITEIRYSRNFPIGNFLYETIGATITLGENQDPKQAISELNKLACEWNTENNPHLQEQSPIQFSPAIGKITDVEEPTTDPVIGDFNRIMNEINTCTDLMILETYWLISKKRPEFKEAFEARKAELTKQKTTKK